ncbi:TPA: hypothetical protein EYP75_00900 [Candidatus Bathyarchaeota archaeon]|nr:hypothetical protein [Candidatus Bathyarchaeota archaeon]
MDKQKIMIKCLLFYLLISILLLPNAMLSLAKKDEDDNFVKPILVGKDPKKDANPASVDILKVYITNNGTHFRFIIKCRAKPAPSLIRSYVVWLDTEGGSAPDYCLVAGGVPGLYEVDVEDESIEFEFKAPIEVKIKGRSIYLTADLEDIGYPDDVKDPIGIVVTTHQPLAQLRDRAPDSGIYQVDHEVIPELPGFTPFIFIPSVMLSIYVIYRRKFKDEK